MLRTGIKEVDGNPRKMQSIGSHPIRLTEYRKFQFIGRSWRRNASTFTELAARMKRLAGRVRHARLQLRRCALQPVSRHSRFGRKPQAP